MTKNEITESLIQKHHLFSERIHALTNAEFISAKPEKWSSGQQLDHIIKSVGVLTSAYSIPKGAPNFVFGTTDRPSISYEELVENYRNVLKNGGKASERFLPDAIEINQKEILIEKLNKLIERLNSHVGNYSEAELDTFTVPHPIMGALTLREILYFTIYHVHHHHQLMLQNLE